MRQLMLVLLSICFAFQAQAAKLHCEKAAAEAAAKYAEYSSVPAFLADFDVIWACKLKKRPSREEIQFGDGGGLIGVSMKISRGTCVVLDVYVGQDDQDADPQDFERNCIQ